MHAIEIHHLHKHFKRFSLQDINLQLPQGYIMGLIGANGAGKTTLIKIIMGLYHDDGGEISILGQHPLRDGHRLRNDIGFIFDEPKYYDFSLRKVARMIAPFYQHWRSDVFDQYMEEFGLEPRMHFKKLSRGMKLKFALAIALSHEAKLLILDEPTSGLDPIFRTQFLHILQRIVQQGDCSILFSSHITSDVEKIADYVAYLQNGRMIFAEDKHILLDRFQLIKGEADAIPAAVEQVMVAGQTTPYYYEALIPRDVDMVPLWTSAESPSLETVMLYHEMRGD